MGEERAVERPGEEGELQGEVFIFLLKVFT